MDGIASGLQGFFNFAIVCFIVAIVGICYFVFSLFSTDEIVSPVAIKPELKLTIKDNKVDTLFVYKLKE